MCNAYVSVFTDGRPKRKRDAVASCNEGIRAELSGKSIKQLPNEDRWEQIAWYESQVSPPQAVWEQPADRCNKMYRIVDGDDGDRWPKTATMSRRRPCPENSDGDEDRNSRG